MFRFKIKSREQKNSLCTVMNCLGFKSSRQQHQTQKRIRQHDLGHPLECDMNLKQY